MRIIWCMVPETWSMTDRIFCHFGLFFALLPSNNPKNQNIEKMKKLPGEIVILHVYHKWKSWHMVPEMLSTTDNFLSFWTIFCPFTPLTTRKTKLSKKWKTKARRYYHFMIYGSWDMTWQTEFFVTLEHFLPFYKK